MEPQFVFKEGRWRDVWNDLADDQPHPSGDPWHVIVLPLCGCGRPEWVAEEMAAYLRRSRAWFARESTERSVPAGDLGAYLLANMADQMGMTEHGGSIYGAWMTPAGERWLELFESEPSAP